MTPGQEQSTPARPERVIAYIDGFNLYFGLKAARLQKHYWLNIHRLAGNLLKAHQSLAASKYFTARISGSRPDDPPERAADLDASRARQVAYLDALGTIRGLNIYEGHFLRKDIRCRNCGSVWSKPEEKMTDVRIATELLRDAFTDAFDTALIVSGDSDLVPPLQAVKESFPTKRIVVAFPPKRNSAQLAKTAHGSFTIGKTKLARSQLPETVMLARGSTVRRPVRWS